MKLMAQDVIEYAATPMALKTTFDWSLNGRKSGNEISRACPRLEVEKLFVLDMAPVSYSSQRRHDNVFCGLKAVIEQKPTSPYRLVS